MPNKVYELDEYSLITRAQIIKSNAKLKTKLHVLHRVYMHCWIAQRTDELQKHCVFDQQPNQRKGTTADQTGETRE